MYALSLYLILATVLISHISVSQFLGVFPCFCFCFPCYASSLQIAYHFYLPSSFEFNRSSIHYPSGHHILTFFSFWIGLRSRLNLFLSPAFFPDIQFGAFYLYTSHPSWSQDQMQRCLKKERVSEVYCDWTALNFFLNQFVGLQTRSLNTAPATYLDLAVWCNLQKE